MTKDQKGVLNRVVLLEQHLAGARYTDSGNDLYLQVSGLRGELEKVAQAGRDCPIAVEDLRPIEEEIVGLQELQRMAGLPSLANRLKLTAEAVLEARGELAGYAAFDAAKLLVANWKDALAEGYALESLVADVDDVIVMLQDFKQAAAALDTTAPALGDERLAAANQQYLAMTFAGEASASNAWLVPTADQWNLGVTMAGADSAESRDLLMRVVFQPGSAEVVDSYVIDRATGMRLEDVKPAEMTEVPAVAVLATDAELDALRSAAAHDAIAGYDFAGSMVTDMGSWDRNDPDDWVIVLYVDPDEPDEERGRLSFHVQFEPGSERVIEAYALDVESGGKVGYDIERDADVPSDAMLPAPDLDDLPDLDNLPDANPEGSKRASSEFDDLLPPMP